MCSMAYLLEIHREPSTCSLIIFFVFYLILSHLFKHCFFLAPYPVIVEFSKTLVLGIFTVSDMFIILFFAFLSSFPLYFSVNTFHRHLSVHVLSCLQYLLNLSVEFLISGIEFIFIYNFCFF